MGVNTQKWMWCVTCVVCVLVLGLIDWLTGYELNFFVFYFAPVAAAAWFLGLFGSVALSVFSALVWFGADFLSGHTYSSSAYAVWNTMIRLVSFLAIGVSLARLRQAFELERETAKALRKSLSEVRILETFLPICAQCKKIRNQQGDWQQLEAYIGQHTDTQFSHGCCPECFNKALAEAGLTEEQVRRGG